MLDVSDLTLSFIRYDTGLIRKDMQVLNGLDLHVGRGELVAVAGASGSGKSLLAHAVLGTLPGNARVSGSLRFKGAPLTAERQKVLRGREMALIPQSVAFLDPLQRIGAQVRRAAFLSGASKKTAADRQRRAFERYRLPASSERLFPFQISGGMARRVLLATATVGNADLLIADEPTPGLHADILRESLRHLRDLADEGRGVLLISHELEGVLEVADKVAVFYAGTVVEEAPAGDFRDGGGRLRHPFTGALWRALPNNGFEPVQGVQPPPGQGLEACPYLDRCPDGSKRCSDGLPPFRSLRGGFVRCHHA